MEVENVVIYNPKLQVSNVVYNRCRDKQYTHTPSMRSDWNNVFDVPTN